MTSIRELPDMLQRGQLVMTDNGTIGLILTIFDAVTYQPMHAELLIGSKVIMVPCNKLRRMPDVFRGGTVEELISHQSAKKQEDIIRKEDIEYYYNFEGIPKLEY